MTNAKKSQEAYSALQQNQRELIDAAASLGDPTRSTFIQDEAMSATLDVLLERRVFFLNEEQWNAFYSALDAPAVSNEKLAKLLASQSPWE
jgi:uncharacterized protein (DUF1778 family)